MRNPYEVLGVSANADLETVKKAYRKLAKENHPDRCIGDPKAADRFKEIQTAFDSIVNKKPQGFDINSIFNDFFTGAASRVRKKGKNLHRTIELTLEEIYTGVKKSISVDTKVFCKKCDGTGFMDWQECARCSGTGQSFVQKPPFSIYTTCTDCNGLGRHAKNPCKDCQGSGSVKTGEREVFIDIVPGIEEGIQMVGGGLGDPIKDGVPGDLIFTVQTKPHKYFTRKGNDLYLDLPISYAELVLGTKIEIPCLNGEKTTLNIEKGSSFDSHIVIKKMGMPKLNGKGKGSMVVVLKLTIPDKLEDSYKTIMENLLQEDKKLIDRSFLN